MFRLVAILLVILHVLVSRTVSIDPVDWQESCSGNFTGLGDCCTCDGPAGPPNSSLQTITPVDRTIYPGLGADFSLSSEGSNLAVGYQPGRYPGEVLVIPGDSGAYSYYFSVSSSLLPVAGSVLRAYPQHLVVSDGEYNVWVYVKTRNPPWSLLGMINPPGDYYDYASGATTFGSDHAYVSETGQLLILDSAISQLMVYHVYALDTVTQTLTFPVTPSSPSVSGLCVSFPFAFLSTRSGAVQIVQFQSGTLTWVQVGSLYDSRITGTEISCTEDVVAVNGIDSQTQRGKVLLFARSGISLTFSQELGEPEGSAGLRLFPQYFGFSLDMCDYSLGPADFGTRLIVSNPMAPSSVSATGWVYLFEKSTLNGLFKLCRSFTDDAQSFKTDFGYHLDMSGRLLVFSAPALRTSNPGNLYAYNIDRSKCVGCDKTMNSREKLDVCGVCGGDGTSCLGCDGVQLSGATFDRCAVCGGNDTTCLYVMTLPSNTTNTSPTIGVATSKSLGCNRGVETRIYLKLPSISSGTPFSNSAVTSLQTITDSQTANITLGPVTAVTYGQLQTYGYSTLCRSSCSYLGFSVFYSSSGLSTDGGVLPVGYTDNWNVTARLSISGVFVFEAFVISGSVVYDGCLGCDGIYQSSVYSAQSRDQCLICGGNGTSCLDCAAVPFGSSQIDACSQCSLPSVANTTCLHALVPSSSTGMSDNISTQCKTTFRTNGTAVADLYPYAAKRIPRWKVISSQQSCGKPTVKTNTGEFTFVPNGTDNCQQFVWLEISDNWKNVAQYRLNITVYGCNIVGCDGMMGSGLVYDKCGFCGGSNSCLSNSTGAGLNGLAAEHYPGRYYAPGAQQQQQQQQTIPVWQIVLFATLLPGIFLFVLIVLLMWGCLVRLGFFQRSHHYNRARAL